MGEIIIKKVFLFETFKTIEEYHSAIGKEMIKMKKERFEDIAREPVMVRGKKTGDVISFKEGKD